VRSGWCAYVRVECFAINDNRDGELEMEFVSRRDMAVCILGREMRLLVLSWGLLARVTRDGKQFKA